ncbi:MAG: thiamine diphosphokinase [Spirochaetaceae bacterium]|nr:thiamine diphosphokinase [Spirochaetaceae bacterium]
MKGIAFIGGEGPDPASCRELAAGADSIVAADSGLMKVEEAGLSPHWIVGDMDSLDSRQRLCAYPKERLLLYPVDKDYTDTELALHLLWEQGCEQTVLIGGGGGRIDHLLALHSLFERSPSPDRWVTEREDMYAVKEGQTVPIPAHTGSLVSVFPLGAGPWHAESRGLKWSLDELCWDKGFFSISNRALATVSVVSITGRFLVITERASL